MSFGPFRARVGVPFAGACAALLCSTALPALAADVAGRVVDPKTGASLPRASVSVAGRSVTADDDGAFVIHGLPAGPVELTFSYVGYPTVTRSATASDTPQIGVFVLDAPVAGLADGDIVVTGTRAAERRALQAKRASNVIQETLDANDVGKLPDQNVAEAIRRLPGVSVADDQGEGRYVVVRGGDPDLTNVTINGQTAAAPEPEGRQVKLDDIPASLIGSVTVSKTLTPDRDANAIAGQVDINTLTAYDRKKAFAYARGAVGINDLNGKTPYEGDLTLGSTFADRAFGAVLSGNYSKRPIASENVQFGPDAGPLNLPNDFRTRSYNLTRERYGVVGNFDYRPSPDVQLFVRTLYSSFKDHETRDQLRIEVPTAIAAGTGAGSTASDATSGSFQRARGTRFIRNRDEDDSTITLQGGGKFRLGSAELNAEGTYSKAIKKDPLRSEFQFRTGTGIAGSATQGLFGTYGDLAADLPVFTPSASTYNLANFPARQVNYDRRRAVETLYQGRGDLKLPLAGLGDDSYVKLGAKYLQRDKTNDRTVDVFTLSGFTAAVAAGDQSVSIYDGRYQFGLPIVYERAQAYVAANPASAVRDAAGSLSASVVADYDAHEKIYAGYVMGSFAFGHLTLVPGVRVERTEGRYTAKTLLSTTAQGPDATVANSYTDVFPGLNARYDASERVVLRGAVTTAIGRPNYENLAPTIQVDPAAVTVVLGNAALKPYKALNGDMSVEYYLPGQGIVSLAAFYKDIDNPIYTAVQTGVSGTYAGIALANATLTQPTNARHETIYGVEANLQAQLVFLPAPFDGLGIGANLAYIDGDTAGVPNRVGAAPPFFQSKYVATAQLFYEKGRVALRAAYSFRSHYLEAIGTTPALDTYVEDHGQLDVRGSFALMRQVTIFLEGSNLTDASLRRYLGNPGQVIENERYSYSARGGIQLAF